MRKTRGVHSKSGKLRREQGNRFLDLCGDHITSDARKYASAEVQMRRTIPAIDVKDLGLPITVPVPVDRPDVREDRRPRRQENSSDLRLGQNLPRR